jgi:outer membrane protein, multidrug efflux system
MNNKLSFTLLSACLLSACVAGPDYKRPDMTLPENLSVAGQGLKQGAEAEGLAVTDVHGDWWNIYHDAFLEKLEQEALAHNADVQVAVARVLEARAQLGISESNRYPVLSANVDANRTQSSLAGTVVHSSTTPRIQNDTRVTLDASYEIDLWGKLRRADEAARASLLAAESTRDAVRLSLTAQVAQQYFALLALDEQQALLQRVLEGRQQRLELDAKQLEIGVISEYDLHQDQAEEAAVRSQLATIKQSLDQQEVALALLLGRSPGDVMMKSDLNRGSPAMPVVHIPAELSSDLLLRRPDIVAAEQNLVALNARIGEVRAEIFPSIMLTSYLGSESAALANLFTGPAGTFQFAAALSQPLFNAGRAEYGVEAAEAARDEALIQYKQAVASAFGDVRNALSAQDAARQVLDAETARSKALDQARQQAKLRFEQGLTSSLEYLDAERNYLQAELNRLDAERALRTAVAGLFKALGGGLDTGKL